MSALLEALKHAVAHLKSNTLISEEYLFYMEEEIRKGEANGFRFEIGTQYKSAGKHPRVCTVVDQLTVTNAAGDVVKRYYKSVHEFMGQLITEHEVCDATIARNILPEFAHQVK